MAGKGWTPEGEPVFSSDDAAETAKLLEVHLKERPLKDPTSSSPIIEIPTSLTIAGIIKANGYAVSNGQGRLISGDEETIPLGILKRLESPRTWAILPPRCQWLGVLYFTDLYGQDKTEEWVLRIFGERNQEPVAELAKHITDELNHTITLRLGSMNDKFVRTWRRA